MEALRSENVQSTEKITSSTKFHQYNLLKQVVEKMIKCKKSFTRQTIQIVYPCKDELGHFLGDALTMTSR